MIFVLAIILTLVAIFLPLATSKLSQSNETRVKADEDALSAAMTAFFSDLAIWPASNNTGTGTGTSKNQTLHFLLVGDGGSSITSTNPSVVASWDPTGCANGTNTISGTVETGVKPTGNCAKGQNAFNHLSQNDPNTDATVNSNQDYKASKWKGPYIAKLAADPFGNNYVINIGAVTGKGTVSASEFGWVLSAASDGSLDTATTASVVSGDDIGYIFCTNCK